MGGGTFHLMFSYAFIASVAVVGLVQPDGWYSTSGTASPPILPVSFNTPFTSRDNVQGTTSNGVTTLVCTNVQRTVTGKHVQGSWDNNPPSWTANFTPHGTVGQVGSITKTVVYDSSHMAILQLSYNSWSGWEDWKQWSGGEIITSVGRTSVINYDFVIDVVVIPAN